LPLRFPLNPQDLDLLKDKSILVTGGTGSFGKRFISTVLKNSHARRVIVYSRDEFKQYEMAQQLSPQEYGEIRYFIGDVRDRDRLTLAMRDVDIVVHAAALKHIPAAEYNPFECIRTNVYGAENVVMAAIANGVQKVIALSTDKAANPINLYGASKLSSDKIFVAANNLSGAGGPRFAIVRYGNVVGSRGSVVPFFRGLVAKNAKSLPITDVRMTRFWITLQQGVNFVVNRLGVMRGGEIFVPKFPSMKVTDLANILAPGLKHEVVGIRPGEKLHEEMVTEEDSRQTLDLKSSLLIQPTQHFWNPKQYLDAGATAVGEGFSYSSDNNTEWLDEAGLMTMLESTDAAA